MRLPTPSLQLPPEQQEMLIHVTYRRHTEKRHQEIARDAPESLAKYRTGELIPQPIEDIPKELRQSLNEDP